MTTVVRAGPGSFGTVEVTDDETESFTTLVMGPDGPHVERYKARRNKLIGLIINTEIAQDAEMATKILDPAVPLADLTEEYKAFERNTFQLIMERRLPQSLRAWFKTMDEKGADWLQTWAGYGLSLSNSLERGNMGRYLRLSSRNL